MITRSMAHPSLYVGIVSGVLTGISSLPQLFRLLKKKKAEDISLFMPVILLLGLSGWVVYGVLQVDYPVMFTNGFAFMINGLILFFTIKYKTRSR